MLYLAPMEDVTDPAFRVLCKRFGADRVYTEFVNADALVRDIAATTRKLTILSEERPVAIQIYGRNPESMADAARIVAEAQPDFIDINFGCPVKKVAGKGAGAGLLRDIPTMLAITRAVVDATSIPVTAKTRLAWDEPSLYLSDGTPFIVDLARRLQDCGIRELAIHGRTRSQMYTGLADWTLIGAVKACPDIHIPIIGNGDVTSRAMAEERMKQYGVDAVMIGRAAFGAPWVFADPATLPGFDSEKGALRLGWCLDILREHVDASIRWCGDERRGIVHSRRHFAASPCMKGLPDFRETRIRLLRAETRDEVFALFDQISERWG